MDQKNTNTAPFFFGWEVKGRVMLVGGARNLVMGVNTKGQGHSPLHPLA